MYYLISIVVGWLVAAPLFFTLFLMPRDQHTQTPTYQNTREHFEHIFEQSFQQSNRAVAISVQSAGSDQQVRIQILNRPFACLGVDICVFDCFLSIIVLQSCLFEGTPHSLPQYISRIDLLRKRYPQILRYTKASMVVSLIINIYTRLIALFMRLILISEPQAR